MACNRIVDNFTQGDTPTWSINVYTTTDKDTVVDTTGWKAWCTFKTDKDNTDANSDLQVSGTMVSANGLLGLVSIRPTIEESNSLDSGTYFYDFQVLTDDTIITTLENGRVKVKQAVTISST